MLDRRDRQAGPLHVVEEGSQLTPGRHVVLGPDDQADPLMPERGQVPESLVGRCHVVGGHAGEVEVVDGRVDQHHRDAPAVQQPVVIVRGG